VARKTSSRAFKYEQFKKKYLVRNFKDKQGRPKHTRLVKMMFYRFAPELLAEFNFDMFKCSCCGITTRSNIIPEMDHINGDTSDSRITNLRMLCPNCHQKTLNYKNRANPIEERIKYLKSLGVK